MNIVEVDRPVAVCQTIKLHILVVLFGMVLREIGYFAVDHIEKFETVKDIVRRLAFEFLVGPQLLCRSSDMP